MGWVTGYLSWIGLICKKIRSSHGSTRFYFESKKSGSSQVFFGSGQKILIGITISTKRALKDHRHY